MTKNTENNDKLNEELVPKGIKEKQQCFVIMPIGDHLSHEKGHFTKIYRDLIKPAIEDAGFTAYRADEGGGSQNIQIDIIKKIIEAPMAICDLSTRNPNVLFELGIRQAFDLPVALIQEVGTERIFDIQTFNTGEYRSARIYDEVVSDRADIASLIKATYKKHAEGDGINSIIRLIPAIEKAKLSGKSVDSDELIKIMFSQMSNLANDVSSLKRDVRNKTLDGSLSIKDEDNFSSRAIERAANSQSDRDIQIVNLLSRYANGRKFTVKEVAIQLGLPEEVVMKSYNRGLYNLNINEKSFNSRNDMDFIAKG